MGRSGPAGNALVVFAVVITVNGGPDCSVSRTPTRQSPSTASTYVARPIIRASYAFLLRDGFPAYARPALTSAFGAVPDLRMSDKLLWPINL